MVIIVFRYWRYKFMLMLIKNYPILFLKCTSIKNNGTLTFLGATNLAQFRGPLAESLWVGTAVVAVHLGVSRVVLAGRSGLSRGTARGDKFWDTRSSVHFRSGRVRFSSWPLDVDRVKSSWSDGNSGFLLPQQHTTVNVWTGVDNTFKTYREKICGTCQ